METQGKFKKMENKQWKKIAGKFKMNKKVKFRHLDYLDYLKATES